ncbi:MAG: hypothetical protein QXT81_00155 [Candidatus Bathyarchaeia archaeon]
MEELTRILPLEKDAGVAHMLEQPLVASRKAQAADTIRSCVGPEGLFASGGLSTYSFEYWTRDMCFSHEAAELLGFAEKVDKHIERIISLSREGHVPTLYFSRPRRFSSSAKFTDQIDNELMVLYLMKLKGRLEKQEEIWKHVQSRFGRDGFVYGRDWRDGMNIYKDKATFHNQVLLHRICPDSMREELQKRIDNVFWLPERGHYADFIDEDGRRSARFDALGHALAILNDVVPRTRLGSILKNFRGALSKHGYVNIVPPYPKSACGMWSLMPNNLYQNGGVWGLVQGHVILAHLSLGMIEEAAVQFWVMTKWEGFHEWYHPDTGRPKGSRNQLWTAALWLNCLDALQKIA